MVQLVHFSFLATNVPPACSLFLFLLLFCLFSSFVSLERVSGEKRVCSRVGVKRYLPVLPCWRTYTPAATPKKKTLFFFLSARFTHTYIIFPLRKEERKGRSPKESGKRASHTHACAHTAASFLSCSILSSLCLSFFFSPLGFSASSTTELVELEGVTLPMKLQELFAMNEEAI